jgi:proteasome lid subunit RPN8/RPN11
MTRAAADALAAACAQAFPLEAAGFLLGSCRHSAMVASEVVLARSATGGRGEFEVADHELRRIAAWAQERQLCVAALFHSHPSGVLGLSAADRAALRHSDWPWVVVARPSASGAVKLAAYRPGDAMRIPTALVSE